MIFIFIETKTDRKRYKFLFIMVIAVDCNWPRIYAKISNHSRCACRTFITGKCFCQNIIITIPYSELTKNNKQRLLVSANNYSFLIDGEKKGAYPQFKALLPDAKGNLVLNLGA